MPIRIYVIEDHHDMREILIDFLSQQEDLEVCGSAATARDAMAQLGDVECSLVLLDVSLGGTSGLDLIAAIREAWGLPCLILSGHGEASYVGRAFAAGAKGYILKGKPREIPVAIRQVIEGKVYLSDALKGTLDGSIYDAVSGM